MCQKNVPFFDTLFGEKHMKNKYFLKEEQHHLQQSIFTFFKGSFLLFFLLFSISLSSSNIALAQSIRLALGEYECTTDNDCEADEYCGIDDHVCKKLPTCNPDEICTDEMCNPEDICPPPEDREGCDSNADCTDSSKPFCLNRSCVQCTDDSQCSSDSPYFCINNICRPGCTTHSDCTDEKAPYCFNELGVCLPCPSDKPLLNKDTWECSEGCKTNADCKDDMRPFCRKTSENDIGTCRCPDKSIYLPEWQTCGYDKTIHVSRGDAGTGITATLWQQNENTPIQEADYVFVWTEPKVDDSVQIYRNDLKITPKNGIRSCTSFTSLSNDYIFRKGNTFRFGLQNFGRDNPSYCQGTFYMIYKDRFKPFLGKDCTGERPIMMDDGRCIDCDNIADGTAVNTPNYCYKCVDKGPFYASHSKKDGTDNICRLCSSLTERYADQEQCLKCPNRFHKSYDTYCYSCNDTGNITNVTKEECTRCSNRYWKETNATTHLGTCYPCSDGSLVDKSGISCGICPKENPIKKYDSATNGCTNCQELTTGTKVASDEECHKCGQKVWYAAHSAKTATDSLCRPCESGNDKFYADKDECNSCGNRFWRPYDTYCFDCNQSDSIRLYDGDVNTCSNRLTYKSSGNMYSRLCTYASSLTTTHEECLRCDNRYWTPSGKNDGWGTCEVCPAGAMATADGLTCGCKEDRIMDDDGKCFTCDTIVNGDVIDPSTQKQCIACGFTYKSKNKTCMDCAITPIKEVTKAECDACHADKYWVETNTTTHVGNCIDCPASSYGTEDGLSCECDIDNPIEKYNIVENGCVSCKTLESGMQVASDEECHKCDRGLWYSAHSSKGGTDSFCYSCESENVEFADKDECNSCGNRFWRPYDTSCFDCNQSNYIRLYDGDVNTCSNRLTYKSSGNMYSRLCTYASSLTTTHEECLRCDNRYWTPSGKNDGWGTCKVCANGFAINNGTACGCIGSDEVTTSADKCVTCANLTEGTIGKTPEQCHKCRGWFATKENKCYKCDTQYVYNTSQSECHSCSAHLWRSSDGTCYACSYPYKMYDTTKAECERCSGRVWEEVSGGLGFCHPPVEKYS